MEKSRNDLTSGDNHGMVNNQGDNMTEREYLEAFYYGIRDAHKNQLLRHLYRGALTRDECCWALDLRWGYTPEEIIAMTDAVLASRRESIIEHYLMGRMNKRKAKKFLAIFA